VRRELLTVGRSEPRKDALEKVTGAARYVADLPADGALWAAVLRSPHHSARVVSLRTGRARRAPGVAAVVTAADVPGERCYAAIIADQPALAGEVVRHKGEPVALVVARTREAARSALGLVEVEYQELPAVLDPVAALEPGAPAVHPGGNLLTRYQFTTGDPDAAFAVADLVLEETFRVQRVAPGALEPEACLARWEDDGSLTLWVSSQKPFSDRRNVAAVLGLPEERVRVLSAVVGGAFGGKEDSGIAVLAGLAAWASRGTVRLVNDRWESFLAHPKRHPAVIRYRLAARRDGTLLAADVVSHLDTGAYASYGPAVAGIFTESLTGAYRIPAVRVDTRLAYTHTPFSGAFRGFGGPQAHFAVEGMVDLLAARLSLDPLEVRRRNAVGPGDRHYTGVPLDRSARSVGRILSELERARERLRRVEPAPGRRAGVGVSLSVQSMGLGAHVPDDSTARLVWLPDGRVAVRAGSPDLGQGLGVASEQVAAEALGLPCARVVTLPLDTAASPDGGVTCASRMTYLTGNALRAAAALLSARLVEAAAGVVGRPAAELRYQAGEVLLPGGGRLAAAEVAARLAQGGGRLAAEATASFPYPPERTPQEYPAGIPHVLHTFGGQVARVEVDPELGTVAVTHVVAVHDVGKAVNPAAVEGQIEGAVAQGIGYALSEDMPLKPGGEWVDGFTEYLLPTARDVPRIECVLVEEPDDFGPWGAKGVGEMGVAPTAPAVAGAIHDAVGVRLTRLPASPEAVRGEAGQATR
jgi:CO/xanthine dehydrogenase Mo-binding subunit